MSKNYRVLEKVTPNDINQHASLFHHDAVPYSFYDNPSFLPDFRPELPIFAKNYEPLMLETCSDSMACRYDFIISLDQDYARRTKEEETYALWLANEAQKIGK